MSVWLTIPSVRPPAEVIPRLEKWRALGYRIAVWRDQSDAVSSAADWNQVSAHAYPGYTTVSNLLMVELRVALEKQARWFVCGGDDVDPDPSRTAEEIAGQCEAHFDGTFGVMQPTGDRWGDRQGAYIDRIAGSPWIGCEFARRMYGGLGPWCQEYYHMSADEELRAVAVKLGVYWERPDLTQFHAHWGRAGDGSQMPAFLRRANAQMREAKQLFQRRQAAGFPGHEPV